MYEQKEQSWVLFYRFFYKINGSDNLKDIGIIGTGIMGLPIAKNLLKAGFNVRVFARHKEKAQDIVELGGQLFNSIAECAASCDAVITMLGFPSDVEEVYLGNQGILDSVSEGAYVIDMTTSSPELAVKIYKEALQKKNLCVRCTSYRRRKRSRRRNFVYYGRGRFICIRCLR